MKVPVGYEVGTAEPVEIDLWHLFMAASTGEGKTELILTLAHHILEEDPEFSFLIFDSRDNSRDYEELERDIPIYLKEAGQDSLALKGLLESQARGMNLNKQFPILDQLCEENDTLEAIYKGAKDIEANAGKRGSGMPGIYRDFARTISALLKRLIAEKDRLKMKKISSDELRLHGGFNVMSIGYPHGISRQMQSLIVGNALPVILREHPKTIPILDESWKFIPQSIGNPAKPWASEFLRMGRTTKNFLWLTSQDISRTDKEEIDNCEPWFIGRLKATQAEHAWKNLPNKVGVFEKRQEGIDTIQRLKTGHFVLASKDETRVVYVKPAWLPEEVAVRVARGEIKAGSAEVQMHKEKGVAKIAATLVGAFGEGLRQAIDKEEDWTPVARAWREVREKAEEALA